MCAWEFILLLLCSREYKFHIIEMHHLAPQDMHLPVRPETGSAEP